MRFNKSLMALGLLAVTQVGFAADLPNVPVGPFNFNSEPIENVVVEVMSQAGLQVSGSGLPYSTVTAKNVYGNLPDVMDALAKQAQITYTFENNIVRVTSTAPVIKKEPASRPVMVATADKIPPVVAFKSNVVQARQPVVRKPIVVADTTSPREEKMTEYVPVAEVAKVNVEPVKVAATAKEVEPEKKAEVVAEVAPVKTLNLPETEVKLVEPKVEDVAEKVAPAITYEVALSAGSGVKAALAKSAKDNGFELNWDGDDLYVKYDFTFSDTSFEGVLNQLFSAIKINGYISNNSSNGRVIYVVAK